MKTASIVTATIALFSGLIAAWYWYRSSQVDIIPEFAESSDNPSRRRKNESEFEYRIRILSQNRILPPDWQIQWAAATRFAFQDSGHFNAIAAIWTAISVVASGASTFLGALASN